VSSCRSPIGSRALHLRIWGIPDSNLKPKVVSLFAWFFLFRPEKYLKYIKITSRLIPFNSSLIFHLHSWFFCLVNDDMKSSNYVHSNGMMILEGMWKGTIAV
jgi:hypothetical protein